MEFQDLCRYRRSVHHFIPGSKISQGEFESIIDLVRWTPSGYNAQPWEFLLVQDEECLKEVQKAAFDQAHVTESGNVILVLGDTKFAEHNVDRICQEWEEIREFSKNKIDAMRASLMKERSQDKWKEMTIRNVALSAMSILYAAKERGWDACPMMGFSQLKMKKLLNIPEHMMIVLMIALGKEDISKQEKQLPRKEVDDLVHYEKYGN